VTYRPSDLLRGRAIPTEVLQALPKTDLHVHLDGSLRPQTYREFARQAGGPAGAAPDAAGDRVTDRGLRRCLQTAENLERAARELAEDAAAHNVRVLEVRFCPLLHGEQGLDPDGAIAAVQWGLDVAARRTGLHAGIIVTGLRTVAPERSLELARLAVQWQGRGVVAFDLSGVEADHPAAEHREAFYHAMNNNLPATCHAGESYGPASIHMAIHRCGAMRIGHGTRLEEDAELMGFVADHRIPLEICLTSNLSHGVVASLADHPLRIYHEAGIRLCLNTDNTLLLDTDIVREVRLAVDTFDLTLLQLEAILLDGFKSAFMPEKAARVCIEAALGDFARIRDEFALDQLVLAKGPA
jgi:adenosine deaminase